MTKFSFAMFAAMAGVAVLARGGELAGARPNIIVILNDDQGYGDFSCTGNPVLKTPNMDRLHDEGVRFNEFHVSPTCSPTRSALMTGRHEFKNGVTHTIFERERLTLKATTIAQVLKSAGYTTGVFGKWHLGDEDAYQPDRRGFDEVFIHGAGGIGQTYPGTCGDAPGNSYFDPVIKHNGSFVKTKGYCTDVFFGEAMKWIASAKSPFFVYLTPNAPHAPLNCPAEYEKIYAGKVSPSEAKFFGMIANIDDNVGRLMAKLKEMNIESNTLVVLMNDNGGTAGVKVFNAGLHGHKGTAWQGGTRAASFWRWPGSLSPADVASLTAHIDLFPTFAEIAGAKISDEVRTQVQGRSLVPLLQNPKAEWPERVLVTHVGRWEKGTPPKKFGECSIRNARFSLVRVGSGWQLFDLKSDPGESTDVSASHADVVQELSAAYDKWWDEITPDLVNEDAWKTAQAVNPFHEEYWKQFGGPGPNNVPPGTAGRKANPNRGAKAGAEK
jgi:arylsulfatase